MDITDHELVIELVIELINELIDSALRSEPIYVLRQIDQNEEHDMKKSCTFQDLTAAMKPAQVTILTLLLARRDRDLGTRISYGELARLIGRTPTTARNHIRQLIEAGHIRKLGGPVNGDDRCVFTCGHVASRRWNVAVRAAL